METLQEHLLFYFMKLPHDAVMVLSLRLEININYKFLVFSSIPLLRSKKYLSGKLENAVDNSCKMDEMLGHWFCFGIDS